MSELELVCIMAAILHAPYDTSSSSFEDHGHVYSPSQAVNTARELIARAKMREKQSGEIKPWESLTAEEWTELIQPEGT